MSRTMRNIGLFLLVFVGCFLAAQGAERTFDKKFGAASGGTLTVKTDIGSVTIKGTDASEVSIHATLTGRQRDVDEFEIDAKQVSGGVELTGKGRRSNRWWNNNDLDVTISIDVPKRYSVDVHTSGGNVVVNTLEGRVAGGTSGGNLILSNITGAIDLETSGGDIRAEKIEGALRMGTSGGSIKISQVKGDVTVETSGGNISLDTIEGKVRAETSGGNIRMTVKESNKGVFAETSGGNIEIALPKNITANLDASTSGGDVVCDLPVTMSGRLDESRIRGTINGGGNPIHAHTSGGNIRIRGL